MWIEKAGEQVGLILGHVPAREERLREPGRLQFLSQELTVEFGLNEPPLKICRFPTRLLDLILQCADVLCFSKDDPTVITVVSQPVKLPICLYHTDTQVFKH